DLACADRATPGGPVPAHLGVVGLDEAAEAATAVDPAWLTVVDTRRSAPRAALVAAGRETELEAALHLAMLLATVALEDGSPPEARVASGARLWLLGGAVAWALLGGQADLGSLGNDPFAPWADLVSYGIWPVGPVPGRLVVGVDPLSSTPPSGTLH
ncbi:MAG: hypothetical protein M3011_04440, partial [Actinomycetota bacterium]|nr:hypothetical protein [Actinomycetota bacterium]